MIPGSEPIHLDLEKLFLLSVSKEFVDFRGISKNFNFMFFVSYANIEVVVALFSY